MNVASEITAEASHDAIVRKAHESAALIARFVDENAAKLDACARALAGRFTRGGRLFAFGNGGSACDAAHVAVEMQHPILEKRRPLPAIALGADVAMMTAVGNDTDFARIYVEQLDIHARADDAVLGISTSGQSSNVNRALRRAKERDLLTVGFAGRDGGSMVDLCAFCFVVPSWSIHRVQEVHTVLLHLLWDHVHLALGADDVL